MDRKPISKKIRFEVFKRDSFKCQYCGNEAPNVTLEVDHIKPVSKGGKNTITNLITSCFDCNRGKSARELSDDTVLKKQKSQLDALQERREQIEMMMQWHSGLLNTEDQEVDAVVAVWEKIIDCEIVLSKFGKKNAKKHLAKHGFNALIQAAKDVSGRFAYSKDNEDIVDSFIKATYRRAYMNDLRITNPELADATYASGILNNRFSNAGNVTQNVYDYIQAGVEGKVIIQLAKDCYSVNSFWNKLHEMS